MGDRTALHAVRKAAAGVLMANPLDSFKNLSKGGKAAVVGGGVVTVYLVYRYKKNHSAAAAAANPAATDPVTGLPYSEDNTIDPLTGQPYLAEAQQYGSVSAAEAALSAAGSGYGYGSSAGGYGSGDYGYNSSYGAAGTATGSGLDTTTTTTGTSYASNAAWAQAVEAGLTTIGYSATDISAALGRYLGNLPETPAQATIVEAAIAEYGPPPTGSYSVIMATPSNATPTGSGTTGTGTSTPAKGGPITVTPVDLHTTQVSATSVGVAWAAPTIPAGQGPLTGYTAEVYTAAGASEGPPWNVPAGQLYANAGGLKSKTAYHLNVWCEPAATGGPHASVSFTTK